MHGLAVSDEPEFLMQTICEFDINGKINNMTMTNDANDDILNLLVKFYQNYSTKIYYDLREK